MSTKAFNSLKVNAICGMGLLQSPSGIFTVLSSGQVVSLSTLKMSLSVIPELMTSSPEFSEQHKIDKKIPFDQHIKGLLNSGVSQPILKLDKTNPPSSQQAFELLLNAIQVMRKNQFKCHDQVRQEIAKRTKILKLMKIQQQDEIKQLSDEKEAIQEKAYGLADMHDNIMERQQDLQKRVQNILVLASLRLPSGNSSEKEFIEQVKRIKVKVDKLLQDVKQIKSKNETQKKQFEAGDIGSGDSIKALPPKQEEKIKDILVDMTRQISSLSTDVNSIMSIVDV